ncbi:hypothetical protein FOVSG1_006712 [Fusarium oxysporum f. sp. vasinfectum]
MKLISGILLTSAAARAFELSRVQLPLLLHASLESSPLLELHKSLVKRPSITGSEKLVTGFLKTCLQYAGFTVETQTVAKNRDNILAYYNNTRNTSVLGRGTVDAKGSAAAQIIAVQELFQKKEIGEGDVALLFVVGEETGGPGIRNANDLGLSWESVIFGEPTELKLARGHKGGLGFTITAKGKAGHSGYPETGSNAIDGLVRGLYALQKLKLPWSEEFGNTTLNVVEETDPRLIVEFSSYGIGPVPTDYDVDGFEIVILNYGTDISNLKGRHKRYLYGPGSILDAHSAHEHLQVSELEQAVEGYKGLISHTLDQPSEL